MYASGISFTEKAKKLSRGSQKAARVRFHGQFARQGRSKYTLQTHPWTMKKANRGGFMIIEIGVHGY